MKFKIFAVGSLLGLSLLPIAQAQVTVGLDGNVPFAFHIGDVVLPAGNYSLRPSTVSPSILSIQASDQPAGTIMFPCSIRIQAASAQNTHLVFNRYGNTYFLSQVWEGIGSNRGLQLVRSKAERMTVREMVAAARPHKTELASVVFTPVK
jgi:hypothetical protein